jgi:hypothetical protein
MKKALIGIYLTTGLFIVAISLIWVVNDKPTMAQDAESTDLRCVDGNFNGVIDIGELFDVIDAYFSGTLFSSSGPTNPTYGSRDNPVPLGTAREVEHSDTDHWQVTVLGTTPDATQIVLNENQSKDSPEVGNQFFIVNVRVKYLGQDSTRFDRSSRLKALGDGGVVYTAFWNSCGDIADELPNSELFTNGTIEGNECWQIASSDVDSLLMILEPDFLSDEGTRVWFSLQAE